MCWEHCDLTSMDWEEKMPRCRDREKEDNAGSTNRPASLRSVEESDGKVHE